MAEVTVDHKAIRTLGNDIEILGDDLDASITVMSSLTIKPGNFDAGNDFKLVVEDRAEMLMNNLKQTQGILTDIKTRLHENAAVYEKTNDDNNAVVKTFDDSIDKTAPGFSEFEPQKKSS